MYNQTDTCDRCGRDFNGRALREYNKENKHTGKWICVNCYYKEYNKVMKLRDRRIGTLDPYSTQAKGDNFEELTCRWRTNISTIPVENLNKILDNYTTPIDHSFDSELGIIQTKGRLYNKRNQWWHFTDLQRDWNKNFDCMICYCSNIDGTLIERIYIFPKAEIIDRISITIYWKTGSRGSWTDKYRIIDTEIMKNVNEIWKNIIKNNY